MVLSVYLSKIAFTLYERPFKKCKIPLYCPPNQRPKTVEHQNAPLKYVAYYRVSTARQGASGLGLGAQNTGIASFLRGSGEVIGDYTDVESGKRNNRPELMKAIARCKKEGAVLLIAKLDRLSRNVAFVFALRDSGVPFICADMPEANTLTIGVMATMAQHEREVISERTKRALAELKKRGVVLGTPENLTPEAIAKGRDVRRHNARQDENNVRAAALANSMRISGQTWTAIANALNSYGFLTRRGKWFRPVQVQRVVKLFSEDQG
ncbi:recombinase family protein [Persicitalea jodogahamensis]|uniref:recombinase family protein n=1 Tax=Persicitalea jodogahamensis TaxID=402147 RepID=UPI0027E48212|nr:recombinase family protein [Persicitalea jodogahamensis]